MISEGCFQKIFDRKSEPRWSADFEFDFSNYSYNIRGESTSKGEDISKQTGFDINFRIKNF
jgi:hypothetical protein